VTLLGTIRFNLGTGFGNDNGNEGGNDGARDDGTVDGKRAGPVETNEEAIPVE
jgi:hypothetical protein